VVDRENEDEAVTVGMHGGIMNYGSFTTRTLFEPGSLSLTLCPFLCPIERDGVVQGLEKKDICVLRVYEQV
jgi:hypothetical protein